MPMSNPAARQGHVILRAVLTALSIAVLLACVLMWWMTMFGAPTTMASASTAQSQAAVAPQASGPE